MGNIVGEGFDSRIIDQVNIRQQTHGSGFNSTGRTHEQLVTLNNNTAWIKLMSSVNIKDLKAINNPAIAGFGREGNGIARSFVLFNGTSKYDTTDGTNYTTTQREGIDFENTLGGRDSVYGIGGSVDFGLNPMMGITGIDVKHKNRGSIRTATVTVKAFNRTQFEIIDVLYMRLGFSVFLEWGNSIYINNKNEYISDGGSENSLIQEWFANSNYKNHLTKIRNKALSSNGNYDGMLAKVSNYHWSFKKDGSYDITIDLVSMGDVIESLNTYVSSNSVPTNVPIIQGGIVEEKLIDAVGKSKLGEEFHNAYREIMNLPGADEITLRNAKTGEILYTYAQEGATENSGKMFVKLGYLLYLLENKIILKDQNSNNLLDFDYDINSNLMRIVKEPPLSTYTFPDDIVINQMSYNPFICVVLKDLSGTFTTPKYTGMQTAGDSNATFNSTFYSDKINAFATYFAPTHLSIIIDDINNFDTKDGKYGKIMNILMNVEFVLNVLDNKINKETGELPLIDFLKEILAGINESLGGINDLDTFIDETTNTVHIIDKNSTDKNTNNTAVFSLYGYNNTNNTSNFIHDFELKTEITPALSTMITVAATANKTVVGEDNTALSKINNGLVDRYKSDLYSNQALPTTVIILPSKGDKYYKPQFEAWLTANSISRSKPSINFNVGLFATLAKPTLKDIDAAGTYTPGTDTLVDILKYTDANYETLLYELFEGLKTFEYTDGVTVLGNPKYGLTIPNKKILPKGLKPVAAPNTKLTPLEIYKSAAYSIDLLQNAGKTSFWLTLFDIITGQWVKHENDIDFMTGKFKDVNSKWNTFKKSSNTSWKSGFIPFNLSLTMDGLGGMKIYQKFDVDTDFMPSNYPSNVQFLIKNIQHTVKDNKWITKLESFCISTGGSDEKRRTPVVTNTGLTLGNKIIISAAYSKNTTNSFTDVIYIAKIESGQNATDDIEISFTDTLTNKTDNKSFTPLLVPSLTIPKGLNEVTSPPFTFLDAPYDSILFS